MSAALRAAFERLLAGGDLTEAEAHAALGGLTDPATSPVLSAGFLTALRMKGETAEEVRGLAQAMRDAAAGPVESGGRPLVDTCGTGGDGSGSFNLSTACALLLAADGLPVAKHGNRSVSSQCGSADLLEALGVPLCHTPADASRRLAAHGFAFLFAPAFHAATAAVMPVRRALGTRTVFNMLGPLANPARPAHQLVGAWSAETARLMAQALAGMGLARAFVVHGEPGWDEATPVGPFLLLDVANGKVAERTVDPAEFGIPRCRPADLAGGDPPANAALARRLFAGEPGPRSDAIVLNAALAFLLTGREAAPAAAAARARRVLADGRAAALLDRLCADGAREGGGAR
ncbi:MAG: anthranilate phosphoribosyltransferase [Planctomycetota bacterium]